MRFIHHGCLKRITYTFLLHDMYVHRLNQQTDFRTCFESMIILYQKLIIAHSNCHFVMHSLKDARLNDTAKLCSIGNRKYIQVFRTYHHIDRSIFSKSLIHTLKLLTAETNQTVTHHRTVQDITFTNKIGNKRIDRLIIDICRCTYLLDFSFAHYHDGITQCQCFFLIVSNINKGNAQTAVHFLQLHLHVLTHFQVECSKRLIKQQHFRLVYNGTGNSHTLLLSARQRVYVTVLIVGHTHHFQRSLHLFLHFCLRHFFQLQSESDIIIYIQVRKQSILLEYRIHRTTMRRNLCNLLPTNV